MRITWIYLIVVFSGSVALGASTGSKTPTRDTGGEAEFDDLSSRTVAALPASTYGPAQVIRAKDAGFNTIGELLDRGNELAQEQKRAQTFLDNFQKKMRQIEQEHRELAKMYAQKKEEARRTIARLKSNPGQLIDPVASRRTPTTNDQTPPPPSGNQQPFQVPNLSGFNFPSVAQNQAEPPTSVNPASIPATAKVTEGIPALANNLEQGRVDVRDSTIATEELEKLAESKEKDDRKLEAAIKAAGGNPGNAAKTGKKSLRDALKAALAKKERESGSQSATRELLSLAEGEKSAEGRALASADGSQPGSGFSAATGGAGGGPGFSTNGFGQADLNSGAVSLGGDGAQAQMSRLRGELDENSAPEVLGRETPDLFQRVKGAHQRSQKNGRLALKS